jgi:uncharacterized protein (DUF2147 family)
MRIAFAALLLLLFAVPAQAATPIVGRWVTQDEKALVEVAPCGGKICGHIVRMLPAARGLPGNDAYNPDRKLRARPLIGLPIFIGFVDRGENWQGTLYSPADGRVVKGTLARNPDGTLAVKGCIFILCRNQVWQPAP